VHCVLVVFATLCLAASAAEPDVQAPHELARAATLYEETAQLYVNGELDDALERARESLDIRLDLLGSEHLDVASSHNYVGMVLFAKGELSAAHAHFEKGLRIRDAGLEPNDPSVAESLNNLGLVLHERGEHAAAVPYLLRAIDIVKAELGDEHQKVGYSLGNLAMVRTAEGEYGDARALYEHATSILEAALDPNHPAVARMRNNQAHVLRKLGDVSAARIIFEEILADREATLSPKHPDLAVSLNNLALAAKADADLAYALRLMERALRIEEDVLGADSVKFAVTLANLGGVQRALGDDAAARRAYERSLAIQESAYGSDNPHLVTALNNLADVQADAGEFDSAEQLFTRALTIRETAFGLDHPGVAKTLSNLAMLNDRQSRPELGIPLLERALAIQQAKLGDEHPATLRTAANLAGLNAKIGNLPRARELLEGVLEARLNQLGPDHPNVARTLSTLASVLQQQNDPGHIELYGRSLRGVTTFVTELLDGLSDREALLFVAEHRGTLDAWLSVEEGSDRAAYDAVLKWKGAVARTLAARSDAVLQLEDVATEPLAQLAAARREIARLALIVPQRDHEAARRDKLQGLTTTKDRLERELGDASASIRTDLASRRANAVAVCEALPEDTVLVDYLRYERGGEAHYLAFVVPGDCAQPIRVELGPAEPIEAAVEAWRGLLATRDNQGHPPMTRRVDERGRQVRELIWTPLGPKATDAERWVVVPDGAVAAVPFAALPVDQGAYLLERGQVTYLDSAVDLLRRRASEADSNDQRADGLLLVGGVDFGAGGPGDSPGTTSCVTDSFAPLPATTTEIEAVADTWRRKRREPIEILSGALAGEARVGEAMTHARVIHLATHGFFATGECQSALKGGVGQHPMAMSGIALAGANERGAERDNLLTAEEVGGLDLRGAELVVLSACDTALGEVHSGEGVLGLRRAFAAAGARSMVMSLWAIPDQQTAALMDAFYRALLHRRSRGPAAALRASQLELLEANRREWKEARPTDWAAFTLLSTPSEEAL
jgi:CHAT domain-containing protein/tetratricopeptide (TPR) repeat protein